MAMLGLFDTTGDASATPSSVDYRRRLAAQLAGKATDASPKGHWAHILAQALQGGVSGYEQAKATADEVAGRKSVADAFANGTTPTAAAAFSNPWMPASVQQHVLDKPYKDRQFGLDSRRLAISEADLGLRRAADERTAALSAEQLAALKRATPEGRKALAATLGIDPNDPRYPTFVATGALPDKPAPYVDLGPGHTLVTPPSRAGDPPRALLTAPKPPDSTTRKAVYEAQDELPVIRGTIDALKEARDLIDKARHGYGSVMGSRLDLGLVPGLLPPDMKATAEATARLDQIMSAEAITQMSATLKGATTDREMGEFKRIMADPAVTPAVKKQALAAMLRRAERAEKIKIDRIRELGGTVPDFAGGTAAPAGSPAPGAITPGGTFIYNPATGGFEAAR